MMSLNQYHRAHDVCNYSHVAAMTGAPLVTTCPYIYLQYLIEAIRAALHMAGQQ